MRNVVPTMRAAFADATARRSSFWTQVITMIVNDAAWVAFWIIFFNRITTLRGWDSQRVLILFAMLTTSGGLVLGLLSNSRQIPKLVSDGALDEILSLPVATLPHLLVRNFNTINLGDVAFGVVLFSVAGHPTPTRVAIYLIGTACSAVLLTSFLVITGSLVFFSGGGQAGELGFHSILLLANYPADIFGGATKVLLYSVVPAAFVAAVPARLVTDFRWTDAAALGGIAALFAVAAVAVFNAGVRRYTSGAAWSRN